MPLLDFALEVLLEDLTLVLLAELLAAPDVEGPGGVALLLAPRSMSSSSLLLVDPPSAFATLEGLEASHSVAFDLNKSMARKAASFLVMFL